MSSRRGRHAARLALLSLGGLAAVLATALLAAALLLDPNAYKADIAAAVRRATGRDLTIAGPIRIAYGLRPRITAEDVALSNAAGGSRPEMAHLRRAEASLSLRALLSGEVVVSRLLLIEPRILLERDAAGRGNWLFARPATPASAVPAPASPEPPTRRPVAIRAVTVRDGEVIWPGAGLLRGGVVKVDRLDAWLGGGGQPAHATASLLANGLAATAEITAGPIERAAAPDAPWPVRATLASVAGRIAASGMVARTGQGLGYVLALEAASPDPASLKPILTREPPTLRDVALTATVRDDAEGAPAWSDIRLHVGQWTPEPASLAALAVDRLDATAATLLEPMRVEAEGRYRDLPLSLTGTVPNASAWLGRATGQPLPFDLRAHAGDATAAANGTLARLVGLAGLDATVGARVPDLAAVGVASGLSLLALRDVTLDARVVAGDAGLSEGVALSSLVLAAAQGDLAGEITVRPAATPVVVARLTATRIDADAVLAALPHGAPTPAAAPAGNAPSAASPAGAPSPPASPAVTGPRAVLATRPLDLRMLEAVDLDLDLRAASMLALGTDYADVSGHLAITGGRLAMDRLTGRTGMDTLSASLVLDPTARDSPAAVMLHAPAVAVRAALSALGQPDAVDGMAALDIDLRANGRSPHELAASADGRIGLAMSDGEIDESLLARMLGDVAHRARAAGMVADGRRTRLRCLAVGIEVARGRATLATFVADAGRVLLQGTGTLHLADEAVALRLRPMLRAGRAGLSLPLRIDGTLAAPRVGIDAGAAAERLLLRRGPAREPVAAESDPCPAALSAVRFAPGDLQSVAPAPSGEVSRATQSPPELVR